MKLCKKQKFLASRLQRAVMASSLKKLLADGPKTGLLAAVPSLIQRENYASWLIS